VTFTLASFPKTLDQITPDWVCAVLYEAGVLRNAKVISVSFSPAGDGAGFVGRVFRCSLRYDREAPTAPSTIIAKFPTDDPGYRGLLDRFGVYEREVRFYREIRDDCPIPVPVCYFAERDPVTHDFLILLEDLAPAQPGRPLVGCSTAEANSVIDHLAKLHARWWGDADLDGLEWLPTPSVQRIEDFVSRNHRAAWREFPLQSAGPLETRIKRAGRLLGGQLITVLRHLSKAPRTLVHGDFQLANVFFSKDGEIRAVADWQVVVKARGPMDLSHFVVRSFEPEDRREAEGDLVRRYHQSLILNGVKDYSFQECWDDYRLSSLAQLGLGVALQHALSTHKTKEMAPGDAPDAINRMGMRLFAAVTDLHPDDLLARGKLWRRLLPSTAALPTSRIRRYLTRG
jgi:Uncharacterized oxidoreductase dhs-27/Ecdysteroid kinase-like family